MKKKLLSVIISQKKELLEVFEKQQEIILVYLFGSIAFRKEGPLSDLDIGILIDELLGKKERFNLQLKLIVLLSNILKINNLDLIIMNDASISLNFEIIKANYPLYIRNKGKKIDFEYKILSAYLDRRYYEKRASDKFMKRVAQMGL